MESILTSIKGMLGPGADDPHFDTDIIIHINTVFTILNQLGVGPSEGFSITDDTAVWSDFITDKRLESVKTYMYLKVRIIFDPPTSSALLEAMKNSIAELESRLNYTDPGKEG